MIINYLNHIKSNPFFRDSFWAMFGSTIGKGLSLVAGIFVARFLGKEVFGEYGIIKNTLLYIAILSSFGFGYTATKFIAEYLQSKKNRIRSLTQSIVLISLIFSTILALVLSIFAKQIAEFLEAPNLENTFRYFSVLIVFNALTTTQMGLLSGFKAFKKIAVINTVSGIVVFVFSAFLPLLWGLNGAVAALLISYIAQCLLSRKYLKNQIKLFCPQSEREQINYEERKRLLFFSLPIALQESIYTVANWLTLLLMINFASYGEIGILSAASTWQSVVFFIPGVLKNVMFSYLSSTDNHNTLVNRLLLVNLVSVIIPVFFIFIFSQFISYFYGETFVGLSKVLKISVLTSIFICLADVFCYEFISTGKAWIVFFSRLFRSILSLVICFILIRNIRSEQAFLVASIDCVAYFLFMTILFLYYKKQRKYKISYKM